MDERRRFRLIPRGLSESRSIRLSVQGLWLTLCVELPTPWQSQSELYYAHLA